MKLSWILVAGVLQWVTHALCCVNHFFDEEAGPMKLDPLAEPLFKKDSVKEFLSLCGGKNYRTSEEELDKLQLKALSKVDKGRDSDCRMKIDDEEKNITHLQLYYLKKAQQRVNEQQEYFKDAWKGYIRWILFFIPLALTVFLLVAGHFDYRTLPFLGNSMFQTDSTDGMKYQQYEWMRYLILPGNHSVFKGIERKMDDPLWVKYNRKDETFTWKTVKFKRFKFFPHKEITKNIEDDEAHYKKVNMWKSGWDFDQDTPRHHHTNASSSNTPRTSLH